MLVVQLGVAALSLDIAWRPVVPCGSIGPVWPRGPWTLHLNRRRISRPLDWSGNRSYPRLNIPSTRPALTGG
jgi:hypothetical protein